MTSRTPPPAAAPAVVVFGATSYLGQYVLADLLRRGHRVVAVTRNPEASSILLHPFAGRVEVTRADDLRPDGPVAAVVNLAYVKTERPHRLLRQTRSLARAVHETTVRLGAPRLLHASTMAVFGYEFDEAPSPVAASPRRGDPYIESKLATETQLRTLRRADQYALAIVRLGNIVGPASPVWIGGIAQRLLEARPVGVAGRDGYANAALAENIADYFGHLAAQEPAALMHFGEFHHVAEFSAARWSEFVDPFADAMGVTPIRVAAIPRAAAPSSVRQALAARLKVAYAGRLGGHARAFFGTPLGGFLLDRAAERLLYGAKAALAGGALGASGAATAADRDFLTIVGSEHEFRPHTMPGWAPPVSLERATAEMVAWLRTTGFAARNRSAPRQAEAALPAAPCAA